MMHSKIGLFMKPLALTMVIMTAVSLFISFTLTPLLCSLLLKPKQQNATTMLARAENAWNRMFDRVTHSYRGILVYAEHHRVIAAGLVLLVAAILIQSFSIAAKAGFGFFADTDRGEIFVKMEFPARYDLAHSKSRVAEVEKVLSDLPEVRHVLSTIGKVEGIVGQSSEGVHLAQITVAFTQRTQRDITMDDILEMTRARLAGYPDAIVTVNIPSLIGGQSTPVELEIAGEELTTLDRIALEVEHEAEQIEGIRDPDTTVRAGKPELRIRPKRAVLADLSAPATGLGMALRANIEASKPAHSSRTHGTTTSL